jgi:hypothetical protein
MSVSFILQLYENWVHFHLLLERGVDGQRQSSCYIQTQQIKVPILDFPHEEKDTYTHTHTHTQFSERCKVINHMPTENDQNASKIFLFSHFGHNNIFIMYIAIYMYIHNQDIFIMYKVVQIWPGRFVCKQVAVCPAHIWTTFYIIYNYIHNKDIVMLDGRK